MCGRQVKLCDLVVIHWPYLSALEVIHDKALYKFTFTLLYLTSGVCICVCLQSVVSTVTRRPGVLPMCEAVTSVNDLKLPNSVVTVVNRTLALSQPPQRQLPQQHLPQLPLVGHILLFQPRYREILCTTFSSFNSTQVYYHQYNTRSLVNTSSSAIAERPRCRVG